MRRRIGATAVRALPVLWPLALAVLMLGGALLPGYVLTYDMVWVPDLTLRGDFLGLGSSLPRAVPSDLVVAVLDEVVPGMVLQKAVLLGTLVLAGAGAWRMVPGGSVLGGLAASTLYVWNPFVVERLVIGHWPLLMTYAALPWIHLCARRVVSDGRAWPGLVLWLAFASLSPVGGLVAGGLAVVGVAASGRGAWRPAAWTMCAVAAVNAPWAVAGVLHGSGSLSDPAAVRLFSAQGEGVLPAWAAVLGLGGIWNAEVVPGSRTTWVAVVALVLVLTTCAVGLGPWRRLTSRADRRALAIPALIGLVLALAGAAVPGTVGWLVEQVPGAGLARDGTRFVALVAPLQAVLLGLGVSRVVDLVPVRALGLTLGTVLVLSPVTLMPDAVAGVSGRLGAVGFPMEYADARGALSASQRAGHTGDVLVLPFTSYRRPEWNDGRRTLDPLGRYLPVDYLASDTLVVSGVTIPGEDLRAQRVASALGSLEGVELEHALSGEGIGWVVLDSEASQALVAAGADDTRYGLDPVLAQARVLHDGKTMTLWELPRQGAASPRGSLGIPARVVLGLAWLAAAVALSGAVLVRGRRAWDTSRQMHRSR
ncbi:hypothetical protein [Nocardioides lacusdianchii]|uniref:hypothetical protein n=1 Tax=Nocardioides lacusdianchii TaxID=2783664 RepID=UPI001CCB7388|nr:hypothetical protein [Nocardioides lacusdianchii]